MENFTNPKIRAQALEQARAMLKTEQMESVVAVGELTKLHLKREKQGFSFVLDTFELDGKTFYLGTLA